MYVYGIVHWQVYIEEYVCGFIISISRFPGYDMRRILSFRAGVARLRISFWLEMMRLCFCTLGEWAPLPVCRIIPLEDWEVMDLLYEQLRNSPRGSSSTDLGERLLEKS